MRITLRGAPYPFQSVEHTIFSGERRRDFITGAEIQKSAGLLHTVRSPLQPQTSQQTGAADRNGGRAGVDPDYGSNDQILLKLGFNRRGRQCRRRERDQQYCGKAAPRHVVILLPESTA